MVVELVLLAEGPPAVEAEEALDASLVLPANVSLEVALLVETVAAHRAHVRAEGKVVDGVILQLGLGEETLKRTRLEINIQLKLIALHDANAKKIAHDLPYHRSRTRA